MPVVFYTTYMYSAEFILKKKESSDSKLCLFFFFFNIWIQGSDTSSDSGFGQEKDTEQKYETLRETLRRAETTKLKAESKLNMLRNSGSKCSWSYSFSLRRQERLC